jgi:ElaB/YqjD/DUF883 family membrane-anchored ribosome-binding protein
MQHVRKTIEQLLDYIATSADHAELEEVEALLAVALQDVRRKLAKKQYGSRYTSSPK